MKKRILVSAFEPFGDSQSNITAKVLELLPKKVGDFEIYKITLPVVFGKCGELLIKETERIMPYAVLSLGQAASRSKITPEQNAKNIRFTSSYADNEGKLFSGEKIKEDSPDVLCSTLDPEALKSAVVSSGCKIECEVSQSAGEYVCNDLMYSALYALKNTKIKYAFVHLPCKDKHALAHAVLAMLEEISAEYQKAVTP